MGTILNKQLKNLLTFPIYVLKTRSCPESTNIESEWPRLQVAGHGFRPYFYDMMGDGYLVYIDLDSPIYRPYRLQ